MKAAIAHGLALLEQGAGMLDVGAESTRPHALPVSACEEQQRLLPVLTGLRKAHTEVFLSVDTYKASTAIEALKAGADVINDVSACTLDPALLEVLVQYQPGYVLMHNTGRAETGRTATGRAGIGRTATGCTATGCTATGCTAIDGTERTCEYSPGALSLGGLISPGEPTRTSRSESPSRPKGTGNSRQQSAVLDRVVAFFEDALSRLVRAGLSEDHIVLDPGMGFGKNGFEGMALLRGCERLQSLGRPVYMGLSMKSLFGEVLGASLDQRRELTATATALLAARGVLFHRVHHVAEATQALRLVQEMTPGL